MKKITALIMMAIMITIGGVYASWIYATGTTATYTEKGVGITLIGAQANNQLTVGTFNMSPAVNIDIDDDEADEKLHTAVLRVSGGLDITFTANPQAGNSSIENYGIKMSITLDINEKTYGENVIFAPAKEIFYSPVITGDETEKVADASKDEIGTYRKAGECVFVWSLSAEDIMAMLTFNGGKELVLEDLAAHAAFAAALDGGTGINFIVEHVRQS